MSFDHREPGTDPEAWTPFLTALTTAPLDPTAFASVVVLSPHPDDETLGAGGVIALAADAGLPVRVVLATRGEGSHPDSPTTSPDRLAAIRDTEVLAAMHVLHPGGVRITDLELPDGGLREHTPALAEALRTAIRDAPAPRLLLAPWTGDGHRDHRIAGEVAEAVALAEPDTTLAAFPIWTWHWDDPSTTLAPWDRACSVRLPEEVVARKARALAAYASQTEPLSALPGDEAIVDRRHAAHFDRTHEVFFTPASAATADTDPVATDTAVTRTDATSAGAAGTAPDGTPLTSRSRASFDAHYVRHPEGWDFEGSWYERRKRAVTVSALPRERFASVLEIGCATGVLTRALTERSDRVLGIDIAEAPLVRAREIAPDARFVRMTVPDEWPEGRFDLVVLSEVGYYLSPADLDATLDRIAASLTDDGVVLACHWRHPDTGAVTGGDAVHARLRERWPRPPLVTHVEEDFVLEVVPAPGARSVAHETGLVR